MSETMKSAKTRYLNSREACDYLGIKNLNTLYDYVKSGKLKAHKLGGGNSRRHYRFTIEDLDKFVTGDSEQKLGSQYAGANKKGSPGQIRDSVSAR